MVSKRLSKLKIKAIAWDVYSFGESFDTYDVLEMLKGYHIEMCEADKVAVAEMVDEIASDIQEKAHRLYKRAFGTASQRAADGGEGGDRE